MVINKKVDIMRGDIYMADLSETIGSEQGGLRPVVIIQNDTGNKYSPTLIVIPMTSQKKRYVPTHVDVGTEGGLTKSSTVLCEQIKTIDKSRLIKHIGTFTSNTMQRINQALCISMGLSVLDAA